MAMVGGVEKWETFFASHFSVLLKCFGQPCRDYGESGQNNGITHLGDRYDGDLTRRPAVVLQKPEVTRHIFDNSDSVIEENTDTINLSEESHAIDGVAGNRLGLL